MDATPVKHIPPHWKALGRSNTDQGLFSDEEDGDIPKRFYSIVDRFSSLGEVTREIKRIINVPCGLIFGIDYTMSNRIQGQKTFGGRNLHHLGDGVINPYQQVICILGETLETLDDDGIIPAFGFGDQKVKDKGIFPLKAEGQCDGFMDVFETYNEVTKTIKLGGPTNFAPLIFEAIKIVKQTRQFHILIIVADGQVTNEEQTTAAIVKASDYPLSIIVIGVGDGPWDVMEEFDDKLPKRRFDNFQFVDFYKVKSGARNPESAIALAALMEVPDQFNAIKTLELLDKL